MEEDLNTEELKNELKIAREYIEKLEKKNSVLQFQNNKYLSGNSEDLKDSVIDNIHHPLLVLKEDLQVVFANKMYHKYFGSNEERTKGKPVYELEDGLWDIPQLRNILETILPSKSSMRNFEISIDSKDSPVRYIILNAKEIKLFRSDKKYILLSFEDITKRKYAETELKKSEQLYHELFFSSTTAIAIFNGPDHIIEKANDSMIKMWGKGDDVFGKSVLDLLPEIKDQGIIELLDQVYNTGEPFYASQLPVNLMIDGKMKKRFFDFTYQPQRDENGNIIGVADIATDVTEEALLNQKIKRSEAEFRELVNLMPHKISLTDADGNAVFYNQNWLDYVGKNLEEFLAEPWTAKIHPEEKKEIEKIVTECLATGRNLDRNVRLRNKDGKYEWHICRATAIKDENNEVTSWISSCTQIHKIKKEEQRKEDFLKLVSHELKTPVTSIKGYVQLLISMLPNNNTESDKKIIIKPYLNRIETQVERLIRLISEMLDLSRIEQQELQLKKENFSLNEQVENIIDDITYSNKDVQIELEHQCECSVYADKDRIGQVIINFVTNALKYSPETNKVQIKVYHEQPDNVAICVKDFGIGIAKKEQKKIFNRFYRVAGNKDDTYAGFGIGLYLSNEIIKRHHGKIFVKSDIGKGSEFTFILPLNHN